MKLVGFIVILAGLVVLTTGCRQPSPIEMTDGKDDSGLITMKSVGSGMDSLLVMSTVDSGGPSGGNYFGRLELSVVRNDYLLRSDSSLRVDAIFLDTARPVRRNDHILAYPSFDAGSIVFNADTLSRVDRHVPAMSVPGDTLIGVQYHLVQPYQDFGSAPLQWNCAGSSNFPSFGLTAPPLLPIRVTAVSPRYLASDEPVQIRWTCTNPVVDITISRPGDGLQRSYVPVVQLRVINVKGEVTIPAKVLEILPLGRYATFLLTVSSVNGNVAGIPGYHDDVLIRSTSIHNIILNVHR
jgi:hypothetical protein